MQETTSPVSAGKPDLHRARALIVDGDRALLMRRFKNGLHYYTLIGGKLDDGESPEDGCLREIFEETALHVVLEAKLFTVEDDHEDRHNHHHIFLCRYTGGEPRLNGEELDRMTEQNQFHPTWVALRDIPSLTLNPAIVAAHLVDYLKRSGLAQ